MTEVESYDPNNYFAAEPYHQNYYAQHPEAVSSTGSIVLLLSVSAGRWLGDRGAEAEQPGRCCLLCELPRRPCHVHVL